MATLYISEYADMPKLEGQVIMAGNEPSVAQQTVAIGGASAQSAAFSAKTKFVRVHPDSVCSLNFGLNPTATTSTPRLSAGGTEFFGVRPGDKVAVISNV